MAKGALVFQVVADIQIVVVVAHHFSPLNSSPPPWIPSRHTSLTLLLGQRALVLDWSIVRKLPPM